MDLNKDTIKKIRGLIIFTILMIMAIWNYQVFFKLLGYVFGILLPFLVGGAIAFILNVPMHFIENRVFNHKKFKDNKTIQKLARPLSLILTIILLMGMFFLVVFIVAPELGHTIVKAAETIQRSLPGMQAWAEDVFHNNKEIVKWIQEFQVDWEQMVREGINFFKNGAGNVLDSTVSVAKSIISGVATFVISFIFACYILFQKEKLSRQVKKLGYAFFAKEWMDTFVAICSLTYKTFSNFLTGQCVEALILGTLFFIGMTVCKMPYALLVGVLIAFTALIPYFGAFIGCAVGAILIFMVNPLQAIGFLILFFVLQQIEGNLIYPHVVGNSVGLPSIWVFVAVTLGGSLMGIVGMLIFIPIVSVVYTLLRGTVNRKLQIKEIHIE